MCLPHCIFIDSASISMIPFILGFNLKQKKKMERNYPLPYPPKPNFSPRQAEGRGGEKAETEVTIVLRNLNSVFLDISGCHNCEENPSWASLEQRWGLGTAEEPGTIAPRNINCCTPHSKDASSDASVVNCFTAHQSVAESIWSSPQLVLNAFTFCIVLQQCPGDLAKEQPFRHMCCWWTRLTHPLWSFTMGQCWVRWKNYLSPFQKQKQLRYMNTATELEEMIHD